MTEQSLKEMQKNFAEGVVKIPIEWSKQHNIHQHVRSMPQPRREVTSKPTTAATMRQGAHTSMALMPGVSEMEEEIVWKNTAGNTGGEEANRQQQQQQQTQEGDIQVQKKHKTKTAPDMDDWTKMILLKDVKHLEKEKKKKQDKVKEKEEQAKFLDMQLEWRQRQKIKSREGKREYAADLERRAQVRSNDLAAKIALVGEALIPNLFLCDILAHDILRLRNATFAGARGREEEGRGDKKGRHPQGERV